MQHVGQPWMLAANAQQERTYAARMCNEVVVCSVHGIGTSLAVFSPLHLLPVRNSKVQFTCWGGLKYVGHAC
jgi:hypothetical protein